ncbi:hypothetical protein [Mycoplasma todarodis]|uniref:Uncharacterized protein n=1 Tax=Mycoplasma todarodis TaxID=1937191 RepID=A0A4V2NI07_9MOLU|nr:hypothetical protein [Mycoplasma todarodis]TCG10998.1 hypothetical protein C4B25_02550 [Mycoplasma todarodis]
MILRDIAKVRHIFTKRARKRNYRNDCRLLLNNTHLTKWNVVNNSSVYETVKTLRKFTTPQYETGYLMRRKKAFNTILFQQNYDVVLTDRHGKVLKLFIDVAPGYYSEYFPECYFVLWFPVGTIKYLELKELDIFQTRRILF